MGIGGKSRLDGAGKLVVTVLVDGVKMRTFPIRNPVDALLLSSSLRKQGVASEIRPAVRYFLERPEIALILDLGHNY